MAVVPAVDKAGAVDTQLLGFLASAVTALHHPQIVTSFAPLLAKPVGEVAAVAAAMTALTAIA